MNEDSINRFRKKLACGKAVYGPFMKTGDPAFVEAAGYAGMDFVILDREHGPVSIENMQNNIRAAQLSGLLPVVRCAAITEESIGKALDIGAAAVEISQIETAEEARKAVSMARFYPEGERGVCRFVRAAHYSAQPREDYFKNANQILIIAQLEGIKAIKNLEEILQVPGIDIIFIGPYDLSQSLGIPGQIDNPIVIDKMKSIVQAAKNAGIVVGTFTDSPDGLEMWRRIGVQYLSYSVDVGIFYEACCSLLKKFGKN